MKSLIIKDLGLLSYRTAYAIQLDILKEKKRAGGEDYLLFAEHPNVFTIGRTGSRDNLFVDEALLKENGIDVIDIDRGGDITFHGPGQLVAYPIFDLRDHAKDVRLFIRNLLRVAELSIAEYGLRADGDNRGTGLWVNGEKIGFLGIGISKWVTFHGMSINAEVDLDFFSMIRPCGLENLRVGSLQRLLRRHINQDRLKNTIKEKFCDVFGFEHTKTCAPDAFMAQQEAAG